MTQWYNQVGGVRRMCWDEENRLKVLRDEELNLSSYLYDASGERTLKLQGPFQSMLINGQFWYNFFDLSNYTLYTSPYMVMTPESYTKHYYTESDRVVSKIGGGLKLSTHDINAHVYGLSTSEYETKSSDIELMMKRDFECVGLNPDDISFNININYWLGKAQDQDELEEHIFFYHKDHLGSSTQISDLYANIIHHIEYMPYGELFYEQRNYWGTDYKFNAKELDNETGLYYYGARYYTPEWSLWLSVDPLSDKYPHQSNYMYCSGNPMNRIDPDGRDDYEVNRRTGVIKFVRKTDDDTHRLIAGKAKYDKDGNLRNGKTIEITKDVLDNRQEGRAIHQGNDGSETPYNYTALFFGTRSDDAENVFKWFSDNTFVEYSLLELNNFGNTESTIFTSHREDKEFMGAYMTNHYARRGVLKRHIHNHPGTFSTSYASDDDKAMRNNALLMSPNALFRVYRMGVLRDYDGNKVKR